MKLIPCLRCGQLGRFTVRDPHRCEGYVPIPGEHKAYALPRWRPTAAGRQKAATTNRLRRKAAKGD